MKTNQYQTDMALSDTANVYTDFNGLAELRRQARADSNAALRETAQQFESLFLQMVLKNMRQTSMGDGLFDSSESKTYRDLFDRQISLSLSKRGDLGLAEMMIKQLQQQNEVVKGREEPTDAPPVGIDPTRRMPAKAGTAAGTPGSVETTSKFETPMDFVKGVWRYAKQAAAELGVAAETLVAQAALETGWGKHLIRHADGRSSNNLFGIKADPRWKGEQVSAATIEFKGPVMQKERAAFRSYTSLADSFADYVSFLKSNPRYQEAIVKSQTPSEFTRALQQAGYATDPEYSKKIMTILNGNVLAEARSALKL
jgi:flagellar protein FlgJ